MQSASMHARSPYARLILWLALPLVIYVATDGWLGLAAVRHNADLVYFHVLDTAAQMISGQIEWDEGCLYVSALPAALTVFIAPETSVHDQMTYQANAKHGRLLAGRPDFGTRPALDVAGLVDAGIYTDTVEGRFVYVAAVMRTMHDAGCTERVVACVVQTMNGRDAVIRRLWWSTTVHQLALMGLALAMTLIGLTLELRPILRLAGNAPIRAPTDLAPLDPDGLQYGLQPIAGAFNQYLQRIADNALIQKRFVADATHQMCTPLVIPDTQMQVMTQTNADTTLHEVLRAARASTRNLADLTNDSLLLSQVESPATISEVMDLSQVAHTVLEDLTLLTDGYRIGLGIELADLPVWTSSNRTLIAALLFNLIDNAVRYTQGGGHVTVRVSADYGWAMLTVADSGPGIPPEAYTRMSERFMRLDGMQTQGTGLGLAIVRQTVDRIGGQIALTSGPGDIGLAVTVRLQRTSAPAAG